MHHTDYSSNLRKVQHKTIKSLSPNRSERRSSRGSDGELLRATVAALLVIMVLINMDPANASDTMATHEQGVLLIE